MTRVLLRCGTMLLAVIAVVYACSFSEAASGSRSRWYVMTPWGPVAKTQLYGGAYIRNPARIQQYQQMQEQAMKGRSGDTRTTTRPTTKKQ